MNDLSSSPSLSPDLLKMYNSLSDVNKQIFVKVFKYLWGVVCPLSRFVRHGGILHSFWAVDQIRDKYGLNDTRLVLLSYLYQVSNAGKKVVHTDTIYNGMILPNIIESTKRRELFKLKHDGYINRTRRDPSRLHYVSGFSPGNAFIILLPSGVSLIEKFEKELYNLLLQSSLNDLTGANKKP